MSRWYSVLTAVVLLLAAATQPLRAFAEVAQGSGGVAIELPNGWLVATDANGKFRDEMLRQHPRLEPYAAGDHALFVFDPAGASPTLICVSIDIQPGKDIELNDAFLEKTKDINFAVVEGPGGQVLDETHRLAEIGGRQVFVVEAVIRMGGADTCQIAYLMPIGDKAYVLTCFAPLADKARVTPIFETMVASFTLNGQAQATGNAPAKARANNAAAPAPPSDTNLLVILLTTLGTLVLVLASATVYAILSTKKKARARAQKRAQRLQRG